MKPDLSKLTEFISGHDGGSSRKWRGFLYLSVMLFLLGLALIFKGAGLIALGVIVTGLTTLYGIYCGINHAEKRVQRLAAADVLRTQVNGQELPVSSGGAEN